MNTSKLNAFVKRNQNRFAKHNSLNAIVAKCQDMVGVDRHSYDKDAISFLYEESYNRLSLEDSNVVEVKVLFVVDYKNNVTKVEGELSKYMKNKWRYVISIQYSYSYDIIHHCIPLTFVYY